MIEALTVWAGIWATEGGCRKYCSDHQHRMNVAYYQTYDECLEAMNWRKGICLPVNAEPLSESYIYPPPLTLKQAIEKAKKDPTP